MTAFLLLTVLLGSALGNRTVVTTWPFSEATDKAFEAMDEGQSYLEALVAGCSYCDTNPDDCGRSVGPGRPNEAGETTLDAVIMDGVTHDTGAVGCLKRVQRASEVAYEVLRRTGHTFLVGEDATQFALQMGFEEVDLETEASHENHQRWVERDCQPNHRKNVVPDPTENCGPYSPALDVHNWQRPELETASEDNHDTIGMVVVDDDGNVAAGASTNGMTYKVPGRVGDSPIPGAGAYADAAIGGAAATGNGDIMIRFLPSKMAVFYMGQGHSPAEAARLALTPLAQKYPNFSGALIVLRNDGEYGAACYGFPSFNYRVRKQDDEEARPDHVQCFDL